MKTGLIGLVGLISLIGLMGVIGCSAPAKRPRPTAPPRHQLAVWPWKGSLNEELSKGLSRRTAASKDDTKVELYTVTRSMYQLDLFDWDAFDEAPFNNRTNLDQPVERVLEESVGSARPVLAWNGPFFAYTNDHQGTHIAPVVLGSKLHYSVGNHRWTFGETSRGELVTMHMPNREELERQHFRWASGGLQCLVRDGKPLKLEPFPENEPKRGPVPSAPDEAGHIPINDHIRTSRTSIAWSKDGQKLYVLIVLAPQIELESKVSLKQSLRNGGETVANGGWTLADVQRFWLSLGVWGAVNSDGGSVVQRALRLPDGLLDVVRSRGAPTEGSLMSFVVRRR